MEDINFSLKIFNKNQLLVDIELLIKDTLALIGESGSGKSLTLKAILRLLPKNLTYELKGNIPSPVSIVVQNPFTALSPLTKIKDHFEVDKSEQKKFLELVELDESFLERFPSQLSGGQLQRVIIALALSINPKFLLLDEPTTALDSKTKENILLMINDLREKLGFKLLYVTHDIDSSKFLCEDIAVIKKGKIIEKGKVLEVLMHPKESYTKALIEANFKNRGFRE